MKPGRSRGKRWRPRPAPERMIEAGAWGHQNAEPRRKAEAGLQQIAAFEPKALRLFVAGSTGFGRVGVWRGGGRPNISVAAPFVWRCLTGLTVAPFPHPAHRTGHADLPHPALGQDVTPSPTTGPDQAVRGVRAGSARKGARGDNSRPCVA